MTPSHLPTWTTLSCRALPPSPLMAVHSATGKPFFVRAPFDLALSFPPSSLPSLVVYTRRSYHHTACQCGTDLPPDWHGSSQNETSVPDLEHAFLSSSATTTEAPHPSPSPSLISDVLTVEQIRDIVAPTRGFFVRDYSLGLGWNNVSLCGVPFDTN